MIRASLLALLGVASFAAVYVATAPRELTPESSADQRQLAQPVRTETPIADAAPAEPATAKHPSRLSEVTFELRPATGEDRPPERDIAATPVRDVTPPDMTAGPKVSGPLTRVALPEPEPEARVERLFQPIVVAAGTIKVRGRDIRLAGIAALGFDERCGEGAAAWPCGRMARAALRRFIRGRAIECDVPPGADDIPDPATCRIGGEDIAQWLVTQGWAKRDGNRYGEEEDAARRAKLGLWSEERPGDQAEVATSG